MGHLDDAGLLRLLSAIVLQWWRECDDPQALASFLEMPVDVVIRQRPQRIDGWRRRDLVERSC